MQVAKLMAIANTDGVNVRSEPNTESSIWTQIASSEKFLVASQQDGWVEIELDDSTAFISSDYVDVKYGLNEAIPYTPVVEAPAKGNGSTGSSKPSGGTTSKPGKGGSSKPSGGSANDGAAGSSAGSVSSKRAQIANYAVQFCGQSLRMGRHEPYKRRGLLWLYHVCHGPLWGIPAPQLCGPGKLRKIHQIQPDAAWRSGILFRQRRRDQPCGPLYRQRPGGPCLQ